MIVTNPCTNDARVLKEATTLSKYGYDVVILAIMGNNTIKLEHTDSFIIKRMKRRFKSNTLLGKLEFTFKFTIVSITEKASIYHAHDLSTLFECYIASRINKSKIVYDSHELSINSYGKKKFGEFLYYILEKLLIKKMNRVITVNKFIAKELRNRYDLINNPMVVMNCPPLELCDDKMKSVSADIRNLKFSGKKVILYQGGFQEGRGLRQLIETFKYLSDEYSLLMVGDGPLRDDLERAVRKMHLNYKIFFTGMVSLNELSEYSKVADLGVILFENNCMNNYYASPNKLFEYIHASIPVLAPDYPFFREIIEKYDVGVLINKIESKTIANKIKNILNNIEKYNILKNNTQRAKKELNWEVEEKKFINIYKNL